MDYAKQCRQISNSFYNMGLEKANIRDLSGAVDCLKKSVHFNKYHIEARNLLGLVYYEIGETAEALVQWVISCNLQPEKNRAVHYLHDIQGRLGKLEAESINIKKYNQGLAYAQSGSDDLAILQLSRVVEQNPHFIKAHMVLALLYMNRKDYTKAGKSLYKVLQIDKNNPKALWYMSIVKSNTGRAEVERKKLANAFSHRKMQDDDVIMPPTYRENTGWQTILNIVVGLVMGVVAVFFLVLPTIQRSLNQAHNQELASVLEQVNQKNQELADLQEQIENIQAEKEQAESRLLTIDGENQGVLVQYEGLVQIVQAYRADKFEDAVKLYSDLDLGQIQSPGLQELIAQIRTDMETNGYQVLAELGNRARDAGNVTEALTYYQKSLNLKGDNPQVLYDMAMVYQTSGDEDRARELWGMVIMNYPNTELANLSKTARGY